MNDFICSLEKKFGTKIIRSSKFVHGQNSFDLNEDGSVERLYLFELGLKDLTRLIPISTQLTNLSLEDCGIDDLGAMKEFTNLKKLDLCFNPITNSSLENLGFLNKLKELHLDYTDIDDTTSLGNLSNLEELYLNDCSQIREVKGLEKLTRLVLLNIDSTSIRSLENIFVHDLIRSLSSKYASIDRISGLDRFPFLEELVIAGQNLLKIEGFQNSSLLKNLRLSTTRIEVIEGLENLCNLEILDLNHNEIKRVDGLNTLLKLRQLNLSENEISKVENLDKLANLEYALFEFNNIQEFDTKFLTHLNSKCLISLVGNPISNVIGHIPKNITVQFNDSEWTPKSIC